MSARGVRLGGVRITVSPGTLITIALVAFIVFPAVEYQVQRGDVAFAVAAGVALFMMLSVFAHEAAHAVAARLSGATVEHIALTLWGGHTTYRGRALHPLASAAVSLSGPLVNAAIGVACSTAAAAVRTSVEENAFALTGASVGLVSFFTVSAALNYALAVFNSLPGLPMDGGRAAEALLRLFGVSPFGATTITAWIGRILAAALVAVPVLRALITGHQPSLIFMVWAVFIAVFLFTGASSALAEARVLRRSEHLRLLQLAEPIAQLDTGAALADALPSLPPSGLFTTGTGQVFAVDSQAVSAVPETARHSAPLSAVSRPIGPIGVVSEHLDGSSLLRELAQQNATLFLIRNDRGEVTGAIRAVSVNAALSA